VSSHYVLFDPASLKDAIGSVDFDEPVLGIIRTNVRFNETDALLGNATATYTIGNQGLEGSDLVTISGSSIDFDLTTNSPGDAIRVITGVDPVPGVNVCPPGTETITGVVTGGSVLAEGGQVKQICDPIGDVGNDNFDSFDVFAFEEQQSVLLVADLYLDDVEFIASGETVSSYYVVFDPNATESVIATLTFPDDIIGVIGTKDELQASNFLGDASANYLNPSLLGLEGGDMFSIAGADLTIDFSASTPGDSIRVILGSASPSFGFNPCTPPETTLSGAVTGGSAGAAGGQFTQLCEPIGSVGNDNFQSNDLFAFEEVEDFALPVALVVDEPVAAVIPAGTFVTSCYVAFDPSSSNSTLIGSVTFPAPILGVMTTAASLTAGDLLGNPTAVYLNPNLRGLEGSDSVSVTGSVLGVDLAADTPGDYVRVLVQGSAPAVPSAGPLGFGALLAALGVLGAIRLGWRLRRRG